MSIVLPNTIVYFFALVTIWSILLRFLMQLVRLPSWLRGAVILELYEGYKWCLKIEIL